MTGLVLLEPVIHASIPSSLICGLARITLLAYAETYATVYNFPPELQYPQSNIRPIFGFTLKAALQAALHICTIRGLAPFGRRNGRLDRAVKYIDGLFWLAKDNLDIHNNAFNVGCIEAKLRATKSKFLIRDIHGSLVFLWSDGDDFIYSAGEGGVDKVYCGGGTDTVVVDPSDQYFDCENVSFFS